MAPRFFCNKCLNPVRVLEENPNSTSSTGRSSSACNVLTSCYHILCQMCRPRVTKGQPAKCTKCYKPCQVMDIRRSSMPLQKQLLFMPVQKSFDLVQTVRRFQQFQNSSNNHLFSKYRHKLRSDGANMVEKWRKGAQKAQLVKQINTKMRHCYKRLKDYRKIKMEERARREQYIHAAKRARYESPPLQSSNQRREPPRTDTPPPPYSPMSFETPINHQYRQQHQYESQDRHRPQAQPSAQHQRHISGGGHETHQARDPYRSNQPTRDQRPVASRPRDMTPNQHEQYQRPSQSSRHNPNEMIDRSRSRERAPLQSRQILIYPGGRRFSVELPESFMNYPRPMSTLAAASLVRPPPQTDPRHRRI